MAHSFSRVAGRSTPLLRTNVFSEELLPLLQLDVTDTAALATAGLDLAAPFTTSLLPAGRVACFGLKDVAAFRSRADGALRAEGPAWAGAVPGVTAAAALRGAEPSVGYVLKGGDEEYRRAGGDFYETRKFGGRCDVMLSESIFRVLAGRRQIGGRRRRGQREAE